MKAKELRKLHWQMALVGALFASCVVIAIVIVCNRPFFESFLKETYKFNRKGMPKGVPQLLTQAESGKIDATAFKKLEDQQKLALYDVWITDENLDKELPAVLTEAAEQLFLQRAERTLVCGTQEQRLRGLKFFEWSRSDEALARLAYARAWAKRRQLDELLPEIDATADRIQAATAEREQEKLQGRPNVEEVLN